MKTAKKSLSLISTDTKDQEFANQIALTAGLSLQNFQNIQEAIQAFTKEENSPILLVDASEKEKHTHFESLLQKSAGLFSDKVDPNYIHFLTTKPLDESKYLIKSPILGHYVSKNYDEPGVAGKHYGNIIKASLVSGRSDLSRFLGSQAEIQTVTLNHTKQKIDAIDAVKSYIIAAGFKGRMATVIANAVDETIMNALYDAPTDEIGRPIHTSESRATPRTLKDKELVQMQIGFDGVYVGIVVSDFFGSLERANLFNHIAKIYKDEEYKLRHSVAGAGLGLATIFRNGGSFFFSSEAHVKTDVMLFYKWANSYKDFKNQFQFISTQFFY